MSLISFSGCKKFYEMPNHWVGQSHVKGPFGPSDFRRTIKHLDSFSTVSQFLRFLARYRPGLRDQGTVNGTQTGISGTILYV